MKTFEQFYSQAKESQSLNEVAAAPAAAVAGKGLGRFIPGVGFVLGAADTANRLSKGDWEGAAYSGLGAAANLLPGGGTAAQLALTGVQQARDYQRGTGEFAKGGAFSQFAQKPTSTVPPPQNQNPQQSLSLQNRSTLKPSTTPIKPVTRQQISQQSGTAGKVTTNTSYQSKLGGVKATTTYGSGGQQMVRANLGNQGTNKVASGQVSTNKSYGATLGGVKGTVKYDAQGNRQFQALKPTSQPKPAASKPVPKPAPKPVPKAAPKPAGGGMGGARGSGSNPSVPKPTPKPQPQQKKFFGLF